MTALELISVLETGGCALAVRDGRVAVDAPPGVLTAELRAVLVEAKSDVLVVLNRRERNEAIKNAYLELMAGVTLADTETPEFGALLDELTAAEEAGSPDRFRAAIARWREREKAPRPAVWGTDR